MTPINLEKYHGFQYPLLSFLCLFTFALFSLFYAGEVYPGQVTLSWNIPATNEDGTPLTDLGGYKVYYGTVASTYTQNINVGNLTTYTVPNLSDGSTYYFVVTAYDKSIPAHESRYSNEVSKSIVPPPPPQYTLTIYRGGTGSGNITSSPSGINCGTDCSEAYNSGTPVTLIASPDTSSTFAGWSGACSGTGTCTVTMNAAKSVTATFTLKTYPINASADIGGSISPSGSVAVNHGANQTYTITANSGYRIANVLVDGSSAGAVASYTFSGVTAPHTISANFTAAPYTLTVNKAGTGAGTLTSSPSGINCGTDCSEAYNSGTPVTLIASPDTSSTFAGWSGACSGTGTCTVTMNAAKSVTATFTLKTYPINASAGTGGSISPSGSVAVNHGANQTYTITANSGYRIANVLVDGSSAGAVASYTFSGVTAPHTISANFTAAPYTLTVNKAGTGAGTLTSAPSGINCGTDCSETYNSGTQVTLSASPDTSSTFAGWSGACSGKGSCRVTMNEAKSVTATFQQSAQQSSRYTLTINKSDTGTGMVTSSPSGINCGSDCFETYNEGTVITLMASPDTGSFFAGWSGACSGTGACALTMDAAKSVTATFQQSAQQSFQQYILTINKGDTGTGVVTSSPAGVNCGSDCSEPYNEGTVITLIASPDTGSTFAGWSGACSGTSACTVTMNAAKSVTAAFIRNLNTYTINASAGTGGSISPSGSLMVNHGANQTFTITPDTGYKVAEVMVDGTSAGNGTSYIFSNVTANHAISVSFSMLDYDTDGVPDLEEFGPESDNQNYDGNNDGVPDYRQNSTASLHTFNGKRYITIYSPYGHALRNVIVMNVPPQAPAGMHFPYQFIEFIVSNAAQGTGTVIIKLPEGTSIETYYKYGPTSDNATSHWYEFLFDGQTGAEISGNTITLHLVDGLRGDDDLTADGRIFDQGGPAETSTGVPVTGQTVSYAVGDDGYIQAGVEWPTPRFIDNGDGTVTDSLTGLMWLKDGGCLKKRWKDAFQTITDLNANPDTYNCLEFSANYSDWRIPNIKEIESLVNYGAPDSAQWLNTNGFSNVQSQYYWSSTSYHGTAWVIRMNNGIDKPGSKSMICYILPVRTGDMNAPFDLPETGQSVSDAYGDEGNIQGNEWPSPRFTDNGDGTVTDNLTALMWLKDGGCLNEKWEDALQSVADLNTNPGLYNCLEYSANYSDWRLPNVRELESLVDYGTSDISARLNDEGFLNVVSSRYWSSTTYLNKGSIRWVVNMKKGDMSYSGKKSRYRVLPVRSGNK